MDQYEKLKEKYSHVECDTCKMLYIQKELSGDAVVRTNDHLGNIVKTLAYYCPTCGKEL